MRVLFLDLDTLRPDHLGCYGYHRNTSPHLDQIAAQGTRFDRVYCSDAPCLPSRAALISGRFGIHTGVVGHGGTAADFRLEGPPRGFTDRLFAESLFSVFRQAGLRTVSISPFAESHSCWGFNAGLSEMHNTGQRGMESAEAVTPTVLKWVRHNAREDNWLLHVNYWDAHTPYRAPAAFGNPFTDDPLPGWLSEEKLEEHRQLVGPHKPREVAMFDNSTDPRYPRHPGEIRDMADMRRMIDGYDCGIRYMDEHIGALLNALAEQGVLEDLVIVVSSDHGENLGELGIYGEHGTADHVTCRIPLIVRWPGGPQGHVDRDFHYNLDMAPSFAEALGQAPQPGWDGQSYAPAFLRGEACGREELILSQCAHVCQRAVRFGPWLYMRTYHDGYHLFPKEMLFNIDEDPHEERDLAEERPEICREAVYRLSAWHDEMMSTMDCATDPLWTVIREGGPLHARGCLPQYIEYLKKTGRKEAIPELLRRHPQEFGGNGQD